MHLSRPLRDVPALALVVALGGSGLAMAAANARPIRGGAGGPASGAGVTPGAGYGQAGPGIVNPAGPQPAAGGVGGPASGAGVMPGAGYGRPGLGR